jgi:hypothetical protein
MAHVPSVSSASGGRREVRELLFKADHPRAIDQYIDYFGRTTEGLADGDSCGDALLERLA